MRKITATIITYNEEEQIERCLKSLEGVADEIIVIDSFSTDKTVEICQKYNCIVSQRRFNGYGAQKQYAVSLSTNSYILSIDADEILDLQLQNSIKQLKEEGFNHRVYGFDRLNHFCNKPIKHCGWFPDFQVRLFDKRYASWNLRDVHETVIFPPTLRANRLAGLMIHYKCNTIEEYVKKEEEFATINAKILINDGVRPPFFMPYLKWFTGYILTFVFKLGFLDGKEGKIIARTVAHTRFLKYKLARKSTPNKINQ